MGDDKLSMASMPYAQYLRMSQNEDNYLDFVKKLHKKGLIESEKGRYGTTECKIKDNTDFIIWHNLQKNPADLPLESEFLKDDPDNHRYEWFIVATVGKTHRALYSFSKKKWFIDYEEMMIGTSYFEPIAWCEFPEFKE